MPSDASIIQAAETLGQEIGDCGFDLIYGGGTIGVMGAVAMAAHSAGACVEAVTLEKYRHEEQIADASLSAVETEAERFAKFTERENLSAFFVLPGGPGALREALQALEKAVYDNGPPVVLVEVSDYLYGIRHYFECALVAGLIKSTKADCLRTWRPGQTIRSVLGPENVSNTKVISQPQPL